MSRPMPIPRDIADVMDVFRKLGDAARRGLHVAERRAKHEVGEAAKRAEALRRRLGLK